MTTKTISTGTRIDDNRSINCGVSITNQNNQYFVLRYDSERNEFYFDPHPTTISPGHATKIYMEGVRDYVDALADIIQSVAEANNFATFHH